MRESWSSNVVRNRVGKGMRRRLFGQAWGRTLEEVVQQLLPAAQYNPAIGAAILRLEPV